MVGVQGWALPSDDSKTLSFNSAVKGYFLYARLKKGTYYVMALAFVLPSGVNISFPDKSTV